jgi:hypothetical protein
MMQKSPQVQEKCSCFISEIEICCKLYGQFPVHWKRAHVTVQHWLGYSLLYDNNGLVKTASESPA